MLLSRALILVLTFLGGETGVGKVGSGVVVASTGNEATGAGRRDTLAAGWEERGEGSEGIRVARVRPPRWRAAAQRLLRGSEDAIGWVGTGGTALRLEIRREDGGRVAELSRNVVSED